MQMGKQFVEPSNDCVVVVLHRKVNVSIRLGHGTRDQSKQHRIPATFILIFRCSQFPSKPINSQNMQSAPSCLVTLNEEEVQVEPSLGLIMFSATRNRTKRVPLNLLPLKGEIQESNNSKNKSSS